MFQFLLLVLAQQVLTATAVDYSSCDSNSLPASTKASNLVPNTFHKLCPGVPRSSSSSGSLNHPICGDGTPYAFYFSRPIQRKMNSNKLRTPLFPSFLIGEIQISTYTFRLIIRSN
eukprot:scaffold345_cov134-Cylindrotheca_fusiformis.AAC.18